VPPFLLQERAWASQQSFHVQQKNKEKNLHFVMSERVTKHCRFGGGIGIHGADLSIIDFHRVF
jgi:hypothetical protein